MHPFRSFSRIFLPAALLPSLALAVPTAVNDTFTTPEDVAAGSAAVDVINANFEPGGGAPAFTLPNAGDTPQTLRVTSLPPNGTLKLGAANVVVNQDIPAAQLGTLNVIRGAARPF